MMHPDRRELVAWMKGKVTKARSEQIESHVRRCRECDDTLNSIESIDATLADAQQVDQEVDQDRSDLAQTRANTAGRQDADGQSPTIAPGDSIETGFTHQESGVGELASVDRLKAHQEHPYEVSGLLASGGMGAVLGASDVSLRRRVAMKVIQDPKASPRLVARFIEEAQITGQLEHPSIVPVHELGVNATGDVYYTMKLIQGRSLSEIIRAIRKGDTETRQAFPMSRLLDVFSRVCDAIEFAHSKRVIHRDLKPANIMVGRYGEVLVVDWGLAKVLRDDPSDLESARNDHDSDDEQEPASLWIETDRDHQANQHFTMDGTVVGTPAFMSPEQASGQVNDVDHRTDIYALGAVLYNILTFRPPVSADHVTELMRKVREGQIDPPDPTLVPANWIPDPVLLVAKKALAANPDQRYASVAELSDEINAFRGGYATTAENAGYLRQLRLLATRNRGITWSVCIASMLLLAGSMLYVRNLTAEKQRADVAAQQAVAAAAKATAAEQVAVREKAAAELALGKSQTSLAEAAFLNKNRKEMGRYLKQCPPHARDTHWKYLNAHADEADWKLIANTVHQTCYRGLAADPRDTRSRDTGANSSGVGRLYLCDGRGLLRCIDGATGEVLREKQTPFRECRMAISDDGTRLAFATRMKPPRLFVASTDDFSTIATHPIPHSRGCNAVAFTMDPNLVVRSNHNESVLVDVENGTTRVISDGYLTCCHPNKMEAFGIKNGRMVCVDLKEGKVNRVYRGNHPQGAKVSINVRGTLIAAVGNSGDLVIYRVEKPEPIKTIAAYKAQLMDLQFSRHSDRIMTYGIDLRNGILRLWNPLSGQRVPIREYFTRGDQIGTLLAWNESFDSVASGLGAMEAFTSPDFANPIHDGGGRPKFVNETTVGHLAWGNSPRLSFYDIDEENETHRLPSGSVIRSRNRTMALAGYLGFHDHDPQQTYQFVVERGESVIGKSTMPSIQLRSGYDAAAISDDGRFAAFAGSRNLEILKHESDDPSAPWRTIASVPDSEFEFHLPPKSSHLFFPSTVRPSLFLSVLTHEHGAGRMMFESFDLESGQRTLEKIHLVEGTSLVIQPSGNRILCGCTDGTIRGFDPTSLEETFSTRVHDRSVSGIAIRPDGQVVATTGQRGVVRFWELVDSGIGKLLRESACDRGRVEAMDFSHSGEELVCSSGAQISMLDVSDLLRGNHPDDFAAAQIDLPEPGPPAPVMPEPVQPDDAALESISPTLSPSRGTSVSGLEIAARLDSGQWQWSKPVELEFDSEIDSGDHSDPVISRDGRHLYVSLWNANRMMDVRRFDFVDAGFRKLTGGTWLTGGINSRRIDHTSSPLCQDGSMIFTSDRPGGLGKKDLWVCTSKPASTHFTKATPLPEPINSAQDDVDACVTDDGLGIVFGSSRPAPTAQKNAGQPEIWWASRKTISDDFSAPRIVGLISNQDEKKDSDQDDGETVSVNTPWITGDGLLLIYAANQSNGTKDLYYRVRKRIDQDFGKRTRLAKVIQSPADDIMPSLSSDGRTLIFSCRQGLGTTKLRLFVTHLNPIVTSR